MLAGCARRGGLEMVERVSLARPNRSEPWSAPRLRGRGEQRNYPHSITLADCALQGVKTDARHRAQTTMGYFTISPLLTTASQARHAPRLSQCTLQNEFYLPCTLHDSKSLLLMGR